mmetsp:Transcript_17260/g.31269  ORF Transcript_17260/g.31269 Transcript_17260/m.31269 type:complete len:274 (+) Transcript_17260:90-911(+)|eukprot:CAMPEP_0202506436 /NCGR_PEP_ID=MMETSP1361-20130828/50277_1 /ASSEMBLY_ACC=CAM_ASM_000849 /TAXON_ID=210615 /ORGANISM="Staurosira complex sp., Strain CCMP2646" /LENGTH=273 /DNA_ID=CAMNT_0049140429 /DNA_START=34 /DNA_END=855 /DNA_ORIENTATION=-
MADSNDRSPLIDEVTTLSVETRKPRIFNRILVYTIFNLVSIPALPIFTIFRGPSTMLSLWRLARLPAIDYDNTDKKELVQKALSLPTAQVYLKENALEFQITEGYCSVATQRNLLKSIPGFSTEKLPCSSKRGGPSTAEEFSSSLSAISGYRTKVVHGSSEGYEVFRQALCQSNEPEKYRVAVNFLRSSLMGFGYPVWLPSNILLAFVGGHFSPVLGYLEEENLVAIFDTNHKYGFYLCDAKRLFDAVNTVDVTNGSKRGLIIMDLTARTNTE